MFKSWRSRAAVFAVAATMAVPVLGFASSAGASTNPVPFKASVSGTFISNFPTLTYNGTGNGSHLGRISDSSSAGVTIFDETLTAANGDTIVLHDVTTIISGTEATGVWTVTGGTGRFASATGSGTSDTIHTGGFNFTQTWTGTISY